MTIRVSNQKFLTVLDPLPLDEVGWEAVAYDVDVTGALTVMMRVYRATEMSGSKVVNDFGVGRIVIPKDDVLWDTPLPTPLTGVNPLNREFFWRFYEDGVLRHEFFGEDIQEAIATEEDAPRFISISGRTPEVVLGWGVHVPAWAEVQEVTLDDIATSGSFVLAFGGQKSLSIAHDATAAQFKTAVVGGIGALTNSDINVVKSYAEGQRKWKVTFVGKYIQGNAVPPGFVGKSSTVTSTTSSGGRQYIVLSTGGTQGGFVLGFNSSTSNTIPYNATAAEFKAAIAGVVTGISTSDINVTKTTADGYQKWAIEFVGVFAGNPPSGFSLNTSTVKDSAGGLYEPSVSSVSNGEKVFPATSEITQVDYYASDVPRTAASVLLDMLARCQGRGIIPFVTATFTAAVDSFGDPWTDFDVQEVNGGETLLSLIQRYSEAYGWEFRMLPGFVLQISQRGFGLNRSSQVRFWLGGHQISHTLDRTSREMVTRVWAQTGSNLIVTAVGPSTVSSLAREGWIDGFEGKESYAQKVATTTQAERDEQVKLRTVKLPYNVDADHRLFEDFTYADYVAVEDDDNAMRVLQIESVAWSVGSESPIDFEVTFFGE